MRAAVERLVPPSCVPLYLLSPRPLRLFLHRFLHEGEMHRGGAAGGSMADVRAALRQVLQ